MERPNAALLWPMSLLVGVGLFWLTDLVEPARQATLNFGTEYGQMAVAPFDLLGKFPQRILGPLVAHVLGFAGERYWQFAHGVTAALIAMVFAAARLRGAGVSSALLLTTVIAFTGTVQIYKGHVGYPDPITFLLLTASIVAVRRPGLFWTLQALNLLNHEQIFFFWPWLLYWRHREGGGRWWHDALGALVVAGLYVGWREYVGSHAADQALTMEHYMGLDYFPVGTLGLAILNVVSTFIWFGPLPVILCWHAFVDGFRRAGFSIAFWVLSIFAIFAVAHDVYRFTCFLFVPLFFAGLRLVRERFGQVTLGLFGVATVVAFLLQRQVFVAITLEVLTEKDAAGVPRVRPDIVAAIVPKVLPAMPWTFLAYGAVTVLTFVLGARWARYSRRQAALRAIAMAPATAP